MVHLKTLFCIIVNAPVQNQIFHFVFLGMTPKLPIDALQKIREKMFDRGAHSYGTTPLKQTKSGSILSEQMNLCHVNEVFLKAFMRREKHHRDQVPKFTFLYKTYGSVHGTVTGVGGTRSGRSPVLEPKNSKL